MSPEESALNSSPDDAGSASADTRVHDRAVVARALGGHLTSAYQPIVNLLRNRVIGYEALLRYRGEQGPSSPVFSTLELLAAADRVGRRAEMEAMALRAALRAFDDVPHQCFLSLNISIESLADERVSAPLLEYGNLDGIVIELPRQGLQGLADGREKLDALRDRGAAVAVGEPVLDADVLAQLLELQPGYMKLDHRLVGGVARSRSKLAIVSSLRQLAEHLDIGVIAQGIEQLADLHTLERLGIELGQGYLLARPATDARFVASLASLDSLRVGDQRAVTRLQSLLEPVAELSEDDLDAPLPEGSDLTFEVIVSALQEPLAVLRRRGRRVEHLPLTLIDVRTTLQEAALVALQRTEATRFEPLVCVDELGTCVGVLRIDHLMRELAREGQADELLTAGQAAHTPRRGARRDGRHPRR